MVAWVKAYRRDRAGMSRARAYRDVRVSGYVQEESEKAAISNEPSSVTVRRAH
jgi:hypothetical protein